MLYMLSIDTVSQVVFVVHVAVSDPVNMYNVLCLEKS